MLAFWLHPLDHLREVGRDILAIGEDVDLAQPFGDSMQDSQHFPPLGSLVWPFGGTMSRAYSFVVGGKSPSGSWPHSRAAAPTVGGDHNGPSPHWALRP